MNDTRRELESTDPWASQVRKGVLELAVLAALERERQYGLELIRTLQTVADLRISESTLYPLLNRLREDGLLVAEWIEAEAGHPRKYYQLTAQGRRVARDRLQYWRALGRALDPLFSSLSRSRTR
jgi:PadR family transcriptional regulator PadR